MLTVLDEFTRECLAIDVGRNLNSDDVLERLAWLMSTRCVPEHIRSDNGSRFCPKRPSDGRPPEPLNPGQSVRPPPVSCE